MLTQPLAHPGKRPWETSKAGYMNWAAKQLLARAKGRSSDLIDSSISSLLATTASVGQVQDLEALAVASMAESPGRDQDGVSDVQMGS